MMVNTDMAANQGGVWWDFKMKTRLLTCKALADDTTLEETRMNHIARKSRKDVARANAWKKTTDENKLEWQLTDIEHYKKVTGDEEATDGDNLVGPRQLCCKEKRRRNRKYGVHDIFAEIADLMLAKFADMKEAWKASEERCAVLEQIRNGELRDEEVLAAEATFYEKANKWRAFKDNEDQIGMIKAVDYHDTWFRTEVVAFHVYYICRSGERSGRAERSL